MFGEQAVPDSIGAAEDPPRQGVGAVRTWWHTEQPADDPWTAETPVDNLPRAAVRPCGQPKVRATIVVWRDRTTDKTLELVDPPQVAATGRAGRAGPVGLRRAATRESVTKLGDRGGEQVQTQPGDLALLPWDTLAGDPLAFLEVGVSLAPGCREFQEPELIKAGARRSEPLRAGRTLVRAGRTLVRAGPSRSSPGRAGGWLVRQRRALVMAVAAASTWGPIVSTSSGASATTPTLASKPGTPSTGAATPYAPACNSPLLPTGVASPARPARMARPAAPRSSGCRAPARYATWNDVQLGSTTARATPSPPSTTVRCAVAPACSARRRSAGSAPSASSGWARRARCSNPAPRRSLPSPSRRSMPCPINGLTSR